MNELLDQLSGSEFISICWITSRYHVV